MMFAFLGLLQYDLLYLLFSCLLLTKVNILHDLTSLSISVRHPYYQRSSTPSFLFLNNKLSISQSQTLLVFQDLYIPLLLYELQ